MLRRKRAGPSTAAARPPATPSWVAHLPEAGKIVSIGFEDVSLSWRSRVEQVEGLQVTLVAPTRALGDAIVPDVGRPVVLGWGAPDGYFEAEAVFLEAGVDTVVTWMLQVNRMARLQRRAAFRIEASGEVTLHIGDDQVGGRLRNMSEGGLCCALAAADAPDDGAEVQVTAELEELGSFESPARVVRVSAAAETGRVEVGLAFTDLDEGRAETLRQYVFAEQLRRRKSLSGR